MSKKRTLLILLGLVLFVLAKVLEAYTNINSEILVIWIFTFGMYYMSSNSEDNTKRKLFIISTCSLVTAIIGTYLMYFY